MKDLSEEERPKFGQLVNETRQAIEDFLEEKDVRIFNPEMDESEDPAVIYGSDYDRLYSRIEETLILWKAVQA